MDTLNVQGDVVGFFSRHSLLKWSINVEEVVNIEENAFRRSTDGNFKSSVAPERIRSDSYFTLVLHLLRGQIFLAAMLSILIRSNASTNTAFLISKFWFSKSKCRGRTI